MTKEQYTEYEAQLKEAVILCCAQLSSDDLSNIEYYINHAELEMAYELLCLEFVSLNVRPPEKAIAVLLPLGVALGLDHESVYDPHFWDNFQALLKAP